MQFKSLTDFKILLLNNTTMPKALTSRDELMYSYGV